MLDYCEVLLNRSGDSTKTIADPRLCVSPA